MLGGWEGKKKDPNDPVWLAQQTCWTCGKVGHLHQHCSATQEERDAYCEKKDMEGTKVNVVEPKAYALLVRNFSDSTQGILEQKDKWLSDCGGVLEVQSNQSDYL